MVTSVNSEISAPASTVVKTARASRQKSSVFRIVEEVWGARELIAQLVRRDITVRYAQAFMGFAWALLMPMLIVGAGLVFRVAIAALSGAPIDGSSVASLAVNALPWAFFSSAISTATQSIVASANLIGKVYFPRESLPVASVLAQTVDLFVGGAVIAVALPFWSVAYSWSLLWVAFLIGMLIIFTLGCALILSCANLFYRDVKYIVQVVLNFGIFATPVFFEPQMLGPHLGNLMMKLPLSPFIEGINLAVVRNHNLLEALTLPTKAGPVTVWSPSMLAYAVLLSVFTFGVGIRIFRGAASRFAEMA